MLTTPAVVRFSGSIRQLRNVRWVYGFGKQGKGFERRRKMKLITKTLAGTVLGAGILAASAMSASAAIVCSGNVCWHTHEAYDFPPEARVVVHDDNWKWGPTEKFTFREHEGRGYWRGESWVGW
jgi:hypothetical protein